MGPLRDTVPRSAGLAIVLLGAAVYGVGCFLPYVTFEPRPYAPSLYEMQTMRHSGPGWVGAVLLLFAGLVALIVLATLAIRWSRTWASVALVGIAAVWVLEEIGFTLGASGLWPTKAIGYWVVLLAVGAVTVGAAMVGVSLVRAAVPARPDF
jgi:hypothetical protein